MRIERVTTSGSQAPGTLTLENNSWLVGDDAEALVIDPGHDAAAVAAAVAGRRVSAVVLTHGHWDHVRAAPALAGIVGSPQIFLNQADGFLWQASHPRVSFEALDDGHCFDVAGHRLTAVATPGHTPGSMCLIAPSLGVVFSGDTLFEGGPGATRWDYSSFPAIIDSITQRLLTLPDSTSVHTGHGPTTSIGGERIGRADWIARGW
ncbi:MAG: MBL fold metallo-hydrolase [Arachnia sp.]